MQDDDWKWAYGLMKVCDKNPKIQDHVEHERIDNLFDFCHKKVKADSVTALMFVSGYMGIRYSLVRGYLDDACLQN